MGVSRSMSGSITVESVAETSSYKKWRFKTDWRSTLLTALLLPLLVSLGFWQLSRAEEKRGILETVAQRQAMAPVLAETLDALSPAQRQYRQVILNGAWLDQSFLLDNQVQHGHVGYQVLSVVALPSGGHVLVNRGWIPMSADRRVPTVLPPVSEHHAQGELYLGDGWLKDESLYAEPGWPKRIQRIHLPALSRELGVTLSPYLIRLSADSPGALSVEWPAVNVQPEKHIGYAVQWFAMAFALVIFYLFLGRHHARDVDPVEEKS